MQIILKSWLRCKWELTWFTRNFHNERAYDFLDMRGKHFILLQILDESLLPRQNFCNRIQEYSFLLPC